MQMNERDIPTRQLAEALQSLVDFVPSTKGELAQWYERARSLQESALLSHAPHSVRHFLSDADVRMRDEAYAEMQNAHIRSVIEELDRGLVPKDDSRLFQPNLMSVLKSIGAIVAGIAFIVVTHTLTDAILEGLGIFPPPAEGLHVTWMLIAALVYRVAFSVVGSYLTSKLAPSRPMFHSIILGMIGTALGTAAAIVAIPMSLSPAWYPIALAVLALPGAWLGGKLYQRLH